ncbi:DUF1206 domain-containing protein [Flavisolibacter nicotianae]|uniref:DUF1206 domain-containing protein n=1 Tax=Flavisolibacter nicotianae TaxID=2364882 RepID=UPI000EB062E1|nr:DUF1206 domain-containing protein [Flavisolibacter nicotianae]
MKRRKSKRPFAHYLAAWGCISTGLVYAGIGSVAMLSFLRIKHGGADEGSLLVFLNKFSAGKIFVWLVLTGMVSYIAWRVYETARDPYGYGSDWTGIAKRSGIALSSFADALIAYTAFQVIAGKAVAVETGKPIAEREMVRHVLGESWGVLALVIMGVVVLLTAVVQMGYVVSGTYRERLDIDFLSRWKQSFIHGLAWAGHFSRGIILGIIGFFYFKAGLTKNEQVVVNTDKAFDFIGDDVGHVYFIAVALGTICYGIFMVALGCFYDSDKD